MSIASDELGSLQPSAPVMQPTTRGDQRFLTQAGQGLVDLGDLHPDDRVLSPELLRRICLEPESDRIPPEGLHLRHARVLGDVDFTFCTLRRPLIFERTVFEGSLIFNYCQLPALTFRSSVLLTGLTALGMKVDGDLALISSEAFQGIWLSGASVAGSVSCRGSTLWNDGADALDLSFATVGGGVGLTDNFRSSGRILLAHSAIAGRLVCEHAMLTNPGGDAIGAEFAQIRGVSVDADVTIKGRLNLAATKIDSTLVCRASTIEGGDDAVIAHFARVGGGIVFGHALAVRGRVGLHGAVIGSGVQATGASLTSPSGTVLTLDHAEVAGAVALEGGFHARGEISLRLTRIQGDLICRLAELENDAGNAVVTDGATIDGDARFAPALKVKGCLRLLKTRIGGTLTCDGATLERAGNVVLLADGLSSGQSVFLRNGFTALGEVRMVGATIGGDFNCQASTLENRTGSALRLRYTKIQNNLAFVGVRASGAVDLTSARVGTLYDDLTADSEGSWAEVDRVFLRGFTYEDLGGPAAARPPRSANVSSHRLLARWVQRTRDQEPSEVSTLRARMRWVEKTPGYEPTAWHSLIDFYGKGGQPHESRLAAIAMQNDRLRRGGLPVHRRLGRWVLRLTMSHGYRPWLTAVWAIAIIILFAIAVSASSGSFSAQGDDGGSGPNPIIYSADVFLPIINFREADRWLPVGWLRSVESLVILLGWSLTTIFVAGFTKVVRS
jgi:hypothetical protein